MQDWTVLLVDDEYEFRSALAERLRMRGIRVFEASSGEEALRLVEADPPQVIVLDLLMPGMGGMKILRLLGIDYADIPVIVLTLDYSAGKQRKVCSFGQPYDMVKEIDLYRG